VIKPNATILDATAGNRMIWRTKDSPHILWIDVEPSLEIPPDKVMDCRRTDFPDKYLDTIFFDPPHDYGYREGKQWITIKNKNELEKFNERHGMKRGLAYYGVEKYKTKTAWLGFINKAQEEFHRILKDNGMLWVKWVELRLPLVKVLPFFRKWDEMLRFYICNPSQTTGKSQCYWIMFMKNQSSLSSVRNGSS